MHSLIRSFGARALAALGLAATLLAGGCMKQPISPADTSPGGLDVKVMVLDLDRKLDMVTVIMAFSYNGSVVQFAGSETVACNNVMLAFNGLVGGYENHIPRPIYTSPYSFVYTRNGTQSGVLFYAILEPIIYTPVGGPLPRTSNLTIDYDDGAGWDPQYSVHGSASGLVGPDEPDNGLYTGFDVSSLKAGPGIVKITRVKKHSFIGTDFKSTKLEYQVSSLPLQVIWT